MFHDVDAENDFVSVICHDTYVSYIYVILYYIIILLLYYINYYYYIII